MENGKKIREPFKPEDTPNPPQIIEPEARSERKKPDGEKKQDAAASKKGEKPGLLSERAEIDDETTI